jgi:glycerophosphoryl diester phosphodiesterase
MAQPVSVLRAPDGRRVELKVRGCVWSGEFPENSLAAVRECLTVPVARAEVDFSVLRDEDFLVTHDTQLDNSTTGSGPVHITSRQEASQLQCRWRGQVWDHRPPLLSEVLDLLRAHGARTILELDAKDVEPWPYSRVEQLARLVEPVRDQVIFSGRADWNLRRLVQVDSRIRVGFTPTLYLDWVPPNIVPDELPGEVGAYGYRDRHPLARTRNQAPSDYLWERISALIRLVPGACEMHIRLSLFEHMQSDGLGDTAHRLRRAGLRVDVWTLDAGTPDWQGRLTNALWAGVDIITTNTARQLAEASIRCLR